MTLPSIDIVLATYNGAEFIEQQVQSIQNNRNYAQLISSLIVVDDGSSDNTPEIIARLMSYDERIKWFVNPNPNSGPKNNFAYGLTFTTSEFVMLSDQDDVWHRDKIYKSYLAITSVHQDIPALVFTDKRVVDKHLNTIEPSYLKMRNFPTNWHENTSQLIQENVASGCTMLFNRALLNKATPINEKCFMHDWWLVLVAKITGNVVFVNESLIDYRQHGKNEIGVRDYKVWYLAKNFFYFLNKFERNFWLTVDQAELLRQYFNTEELNQISFTRCNQYSYIKRLELFFRGQIKQHTWKGQIALLCTLLRSYKK
ncbi:glycosyltransferase family 2 protein [Vibrio hannami]|uniref:glycosyltransferase family 2 protein n=1 Tax=Vibrio hannami TaxID=2717094 RepID=UPI0024106AF6|nr:glycosyltransferase family 2 protein [Vibrio hannami]MDG3088660.1 glycosyltransferase family 2 protein [Vibrio hannami]